MTDRVDGWVTAGRQSRSQRKASEQAAGGRWCASTECIIGRHERQRRVCLPVCSLASSRGRGGAAEKRALTEGLAFAGWQELGDIGDRSTREGIRQALKAAYPEVAENVIANWTGQLWRFTQQISVGDLIVMPLHTRPGYVAIGRVTGPYEYRVTEPVDFRHTRSVRWLRDDIPRENFRPDLRASITSLLTVCGLTRNDAARRIAALAEYGTDPGMDGAGGSLQQRNYWRTRHPATPRWAGLTIRSLLEHWGQTRRTGNVLATIKGDLAERGSRLVRPSPKGSSKTRLRSCRSTGSQGLRRRHRTQRTCHNRHLPLSGSAACHRRRSCR